MVPQEEQYCEALTGIRDNFVHGLQVFVMILVVIGSSVEDPVI